MAICDWEYINDDFANLDAWTDQDAGSGVSTIDPAGQLSMSSPAGTGNTAQRSQDAGSLTTNWTGEIKVLFDTTHRDLRVWQEGATYKCYIRFYEDANSANTGIYVYDGASYVKVSTTDFGDNIWHTITWQVHNSETDIDIWVDGTKVVTDADCTFATTTQGQVGIFQLSATTVVRTSHIDYYKIDSSLCTTDFTSTSTSSTSSSTSISTSSTSTSTTQSATTSTSSTSSSISTSSTSVSSSSSTSVSTSTSSSTSTTTIPSDACKVGKGGIIIDKPRVI